MPGRRAQPPGNLEGKTITDKAAKRPSGSAARSRRKPRDGLAKSQRAIKTRGRRVGRGRKVQRASRS